MSDQLAEAIGVVRRYGDETAVNGVDASVRAGEIVGLLGANGAGKTTLIRLLLGLERPDGGDARLFGAPPGPVGRARLGYVPQGLGLYRDLSVAHNVEFVAAAFDCEPGDLPTELAPLASREVGSIGLGHQRLLAFHCALLHSPQLLVLDEPTSGVDPLTRAQLWDSIHEEAARGVGVLVTTHYMQEAEQCDRLIVMSQGSVFAAGSLAEVLGGAVACELRAPDWAELFEALSRAQVPLALAGRVVRVPDAVASRALEVAREAGIEVSSRRVPATLDEVMVLREMRPASRDTRR